VTLSSPRPRAGEVMTTSGGCNRRPADLAGKHDTVPRASPDAAENGCPDGCGGGHERFVVVAVSAVGAAGCESPWRPPYGFTIPSRQQKQANSLARPDYSPASQAGPCQRASLSPAHSRRPDFSAAEADGRAAELCRRYSATLPISRTGPLEPPEEMPPRELTKRFARRARGTAQGLLTEWCRAESGFKT